MSTDMAQKELLHTLDYQDSHRALTLEEQKIEEEHRKRENDLQEKRALILQKEVVESEQIAKQFESIVEEVSLCEAFT